jgi:hypothetical protein
LDAWQIVQFHKGQRRIFSEPRFVF